MPTQQLVGLILFAVAIADTAVGQMLIVPRVKDERKREAMRIAFYVSGTAIAALAWAVYKGVIPL
jgi:hypothetical protein